ncbi:MAG: NAD+ synthase [Actinobacteria bacterium]|nr:NAD+ synthase [Actinomycetota bacterium]
MRIVMAQINPTVGDLDGNAQRVIECIEEGQRTSADLVVFPELVMSGYPPEDLLLKDHFPTDCSHALDVVAGACLDTVALVGYPQRGEDGHVYNAAAVVARGRIMDVYRKILLPNHPVFDEQWYFAPGNEVLILQMPQARIAVSIGEDIWYRNGSSEEVTLGAVAAPQAQVVVNLSMSPYHHRKGHEREEMLRRRARGAGAYLVYVNGVGGQDELVFDGHSVAVDPTGELLCRAPQFKEALLLVNVDISRVTPKEPDADEAVRVTEVSPGSHVPNCMGQGFCGDLQACIADVTETLSDEGEIYEALCLGTADYVNKNGFERVVIGLSGGIDCALVTCIAVDALGKDRVVGVTMPSRYSTAATRSDAELLANHLDIEFREISIESVFVAYLDALADTFVGRDVDVTEENIQARIRGNYLMALSNKFGWLVLTNGNKSETAVGYTTLYGDMAGGFAVIKDVPKTMVYRLSRYRNERGPGQGPIPQSTIDRPPSAELRAGQTDQDGLPPYDLLDRIVEAYVVRDESVEEIAAAGLDRALVERIVRMIDLNEYKRRQAAPGVRITPKAFGKDRRLPITNRYHR